MKNEFVIQWQSQVNGRAGRGSKVFTREEAEQLAQELNAEYPEILHEAAPAPAPVATESVPAEEMTEASGEAEREEAVAR